MASTVRKKGIGYYLRRDWQLWLMILPAAIEIIIFHYLPMYGVQLAFRDFDFSKNIFGGEFVGLQYFKQFFNHPIFWRLIRNTFNISFASLLVGFPAPIILALFINQIRRERLKRAFQTTVYMPHFISTTVMVGLLVVLLSPNSGVVGRIFTQYLGTGNLLGKPQYFVPVYVLSDVWQHAGWGAIIYLAALSGVDAELYDACKVDGGSRWDIIRHIELPALVPTMVVLLILNMGGILSVGFEKAYLMQNTMNMSVSRVIATYVYEISINTSYPRFSLAAAVGLFNTLVNFALLTIANMTVRRTTGMSLW